MTQESVLSDEVRGLVGFTTPWLRAADPVEGSEVRRFLQATLNVRHARSPFGERVGLAADQLAPLGFPMHALRTPLEADDPLADALLPDFDGYPRAMRPGLPALHIPLKRIVNGGYEHEFFRHARKGEVIECRSCYADIVERQSRAGPMVLVRIRDCYRVEDGSALMQTLNTMIYR